MALRAALLPVITQAQFADKALAGAIRQFPALGKSLYNAQRNFLHQYFFLQELFPHKKDDPAFLILQFLKNQPRSPVKFPLKGARTEAGAYSWPAEGWELAKADWGDRWENIAIRLKEEPPFFIRTNLLLCSKKDLIASLLKEGFKVQDLPESDTALEVERSPALFRSASFAKGCWEVQDLHSQELALFTGAKAGMRILDGCAGAGGKTLALAARMTGKGKIIALDVHSDRLNALKKRAAKAGAFCIETRLSQDRKVVKRLKGQADLVLLDVPCSGTGVLRRNPDILLHFTRKSLSNLVLTQQNLLEQYAPTVKREGRLVYATCSVLKAEGEQQTLAFLNRHPEFKMLNEKRWWPEEGSGDAFYAAEFCRTA